MKRQATSYWCGLASIANALEVLRIQRSQRELERVCHVTPSAGTNETEMKRALLANGVKVDEWSSTIAHETCMWIDTHLFRVGPAILCVDNDEHWVTAIGRCGYNILLFDPARNVGIEVHDWDSLAKRWINGDGVYYGLGISK